MHARVNGPSAIDQLKKRQVMEVTCFLNTPIRPNAAIGFGTNGCGRFRAGAFCDCHGALV
jgi:hypothetical protein